MRSRSEAPSRRTAPSTRFSKSLREVSVFFSFAINLNRWKEPRTGFEVENSISVLTAKNAAYQIRSKKQEREWQRRGHWGLRPCVVRRDNPSGCSGYSSSNGNAML